MKIKVAHYRILSVKFNGDDLICTQPHWEVQTNWVRADVFDWVRQIGLWEKIAPATTFDAINGMNGDAVKWVKTHERGVVESNLLAVLEWNGKLFTNELHSIFITNIIRGFRIEEVKVYE